jgi:ribose transport system substrate-binding protein
VALFVGKLDVANARERKQGIEQVIEGHPIEIVEVFTDEVQRSVAQSNVRNALDKYPELAAMVGLWSYNTPAIVKVVQERGLEGRITIVGFDEESATLDAVADGTVASTVVQQPFEFGYRSIRALALLARGENAGLPADGLEYVPVRVIRREQVEPFRRDLLRQLDEGRAEG